MDPLHPLADLEGYRQVNPLNPKGSIFLPSESCITGNINQLQRREGNMGDGLCAGSR